MISSYYTLTLLVLIITIIYFISKEEIILNKFSSEIDGKTIVTNSLQME